jgi:hypothetical protein
MQRALAAAPFPSTVLVMRIDRVVLLIPWILVWAIAFAVTPLCLLAGRAADKAERGGKTWVLRHWPALALLLVMMGGTTISVRNREHRVYLRWI